MHVLVSEYVCKVRFCLCVNMYVSVYVCTCVCAGPFDVSLLLALTRAANFFPRVFFVNLILLPCQNVFGK